MCFMSPGPDKPGLSGFSNFGKKDAGKFQGLENKIYGIGACTGKAGLYDEPLLKMGDCETILLDAQLETVIDSHAFRAVLGNGHRFTAFIAAVDREKKRPEPGGFVKVEMSPYDMGVGRLLI